MTIAPVHDAEGGILSFIAIKRDITARKQVEEALEQAKADAEAASRAKDQFLAMLSHELRTPLTPALMTVSSLEADPDLPPSLRRGHRHHPSEYRVGNASHRRSARSHARRQGKAGIHPQILNVHLKIHSAIGICRAELDAKALNVALQLEATDFHISGDSGRIQQVFWNLLKNAAKFTPENGHVVVRSRNPRPGILQINVSDNGIGIPPERLPIFSMPSSRA